MNKAFTKESDYDPAAELVVRPLPVLPPGVKNYITPTGADALARSLRELRNERRPAVVSVLSELAQAGRRVDREHRQMQARLHVIDEQIRHLSERIATLEIIAPNLESGGPVRFGDTVVVRDPEGVERTYTIVGVDEADAAAGRISWISPLAKALLGAEADDEVIVCRPRSDLVLEILQVQRGDARS